MALFTVHIAYVECEIHVPYAQSLKDKRQVVRALKDVLGNRFNVAIAEIGFQNDWQRVALGMSMLSTDKNALAKSLSHIEQTILERLDGELVRFNVEWL